MSAPSARRVGPWWVGPGWLAQGRTQKGFPPVLIKTRALSAAGEPRTWLWLSLQVDLTSLATLIPAEAPEGVWVGGGPPCHCCLGLGQSFQVSC